MFDKITSAKNVNIYPITPDSYSFLINNIALKHKKTMFISNEDNKLELIAKQLKVFDQDLKVIVFPSWDCMPYDKVSPNLSNINQRIQALSEINLSDNYILLTSINAVLQFLPPVQAIQNATRTLNLNDEIKRDEFLKYLTEINFRRVEVASEPGDFAVRGDIIDIVNCDEYGWRIDFFGNKIEKIREFNVTTQISNRKLEKIKILPSNEIILNADIADAFCANFIKEFGASAVNHPVYDSIEGKRKYAGFEHYLPLFYDYKLCNLLEFCKPEKIIFNHGWEQSLNLKLEQIQGHFEQRKELINTSFKDEIVQLPIKPETMWFTRDSLFNEIEKYEKIFCNEFSIDKSNAVELDIKKIADFDTLSKHKEITAFSLLKEFRDENKIKTIIACNSQGSLERVKSILENHNFHWYFLEKFSDYKNITSKSFGIILMPLERGYYTKEFAFVSEQDLLGEKIIRKKSSKNLEQLLSEVNNLQIGEYVVHQMHGIAMFEGLETVTVNNIGHDCLKLIYADNDIFYIPVENFDLLSRYGSADDYVRLDKLGGVSWKNRKSKLKEKLKEVAGELIKTAALRAKKEGELLIPISEHYEEFCAKFPYLETDDQLNSIQDVEDDLSSGRPMDRLVCGDVGFGKTEVAMRAAFIATHPHNNVKHQVAIIVPTTLLARQHYMAFHRRFSGFDVNVKQLSRLVSAKDAKQTIEELKEGKVDIVIGTHALLAKDISFKNLGLLIIDEEQRFGVLQKERLKKLQEHVHILTLSATPIPRTLQMSLTGVKDLSIIATPPVDRQVVKTYIMNFDSVVVREAILREYYRGGQIFYVCPRISDIEEIAPKIIELVPEIKVVVAHGQMSPTELEKIMNEFYSKKFDMLLSTTIIESGIDIPQANTIFIHRSDKFGLSALYQLRGRVGRSNVRAFAYLLLPNKKLSKNATARLEVMQTLDTLGAGFTVASHDMDIRGFGNLVGDEQSGHIKEVGLELYQQMLQEAIESLKNKDVSKVLLEDEEYSPQINLGIAVLIPQDYIQDLSLRLSIYRKLANFKSDVEIEHYAIELIDRFGNYPVEVEHLLSVLKLKIKAKKAFIERIDTGPKAVVVSFRNNHLLDQNRIFDYVTKNQLFMKFRLDNKLLISKSFDSVQFKVDYLNKFIEDLL